MKYLLLILVLFTVACTAEFQGTGDVDEPLAGAAGSAGTATAGASGAGAGGSSSAGSAGSATAGGGQGGSSAGAAGMPSAGTGGAPVTCDQPELVLPTEFSLQSWSMESADYCAACVGEPCAVCIISWGEPTWIDDDTFSVTMNSFVCGDSMLQAGQCGSEGECLGNLSMNADAHPRMEFTIEPSDDGFRVLPALPGQRDLSIGIVTEPGCSNSPMNWDGLLLQETGAKLGQFLNDTTFKCLEN